MRIASLLADGLMVQQQQQQQRDSAVSPSSSSLAPSPPPSLHYVLLLFDSLQFDATLPAESAAGSEPTDLCSGVPNRSDEETVASVSAGHSEPSVSAPHLAFSGARVLLCGFSCLLDPFMHLELLQVTAKSLVSRSDAILYPAMILSQLYSSLLHDELLHFLHHLPTLASAPLFSW